MTTRTVIIFIVTFAFVALMCFVQQLVSLKRRNRVRQTALPLLAVVYCIAGLAAGLWLYGKIEGLVAGLLGIIPTDFLEGLIGHIPEDFDGSPIDFAVANGYIAKFSVIALNALLLLVFIIIKAILLPIVKLLWGKVAFVKKASETFYEYDDTLSEWFIRHNWANVRPLGRWLLVSSALICAVFLGLIVHADVDSPYWLFCFPAVMPIVVGEVFSFINGQTRFELLSSILGDDSDSRRVSSFFKIREIYEKMFSPQLLVAHTGTEFTGKNSSADLLEKLSSGDKCDRMTAEYFSIIDDKYNSDLDSVMGTNALMHGKSVVFLNPFYRDIGKYVVLPFTKALLTGKKCLVIVGRNSTLEDVKRWLPEEIAAFNRVNSLWRIHELDEHAPECDIGIISSRQMYDMGVLKANCGFFAETDFILIVEPSLIINIGQIGFSIIVDELHKNISEPVFCICDRNADGLVDTMSHLLRTEITEVIASPIPRCVYSVMTWSADGDYSRQRLFDKQTRYLGNGVELAAVAVKNQVPKVTWFSETKSPVRDVHWIAGQYHPTICKYMNLPTQQANLYEKIAFESNIWGASTADESFIIIEDEFCNMFNTLKAYLSRGINQAFVNVLSENYLLRDYMRCNGQLFFTDPGSVPSFVPDYAKTLRNTITKLILHMTVRPVSETEILNELRLSGHNSDDAYGSMARLMQHYINIDNPDSVFTISSEVSDESLHADTVNFFTITQEAFEKNFAESLKNAFFIVEDEKSDSNYIDAKLFGHITQMILPGQFLTFDGKYYFAKIVSAERGVVLRRASDLYDSRKYYRQIRKYILDEGSAEKTDVRKVMDVEIAYFNCDIDVRTTGYLEMSDNNDLRSARLIDFADDPNVGEYSRKFRNKTIMRIHFPESDVKIRFTICMLLMEVFRSAFPNSWHFLAVVATRPDDISGMLNYVTYEIEGDIDNEYIYIIEDSEVDLGLLGAVDKNLLQLMEIIADFLDWHFEKMRESPEKDPELRAVTMPKDVERKRRGFFSRIRSIFGGKEEEVRVSTPTVYATGKTEQKTETKSESDKVYNPVESVEHTLDSEEAESASTNNGDNTQEDAGPSEHTLDYEAESKPEDTPDTDAEVNEILKKHDKTGSEHREDMLEPDADAEADLAHIDGTDIFDEDDDPHDTFWLEYRFKEAGIISPEKSRYQHECYLKYGFEEIDARIRAEHVRGYLRVRGFTNNNLTKSRLRSVADKEFIDFDATNTCDFCSLPLTGISYERLTDGRVRCRNCTTSAVVTMKEARELYYKIIDLLGSFFGIKLNVPIGVKFVDAHKVARGAGSVFRASADVAPRVLGYAAHHKGNYCLCMENGSPRLAFIDTLVHELTHIWQYINWNDNEITALYGSGRNNDIVYEGMATWAAVQYMYQIGESSYAHLQERNYELDESVYGVGFCLFRERYPFIKDFSMHKFSPFTCMPPL